MPLPDKFDTAGPILFDDMRQKGLFRPFDRVRLIAEKPVMTRAADDLSGLEVQVEDGCRHLFERGIGALQNFRAAEFIAFFCGDVA